MSENTTETQTESNNPPVQDSNRNNLANKSMDDFEGSGPLCYVIRPKYDRAQAVLKSGSRAEGVFKSINPWKKKEVAARLVQRRLVPFWSIGCKSSIHYDRVASHTITISDPDVIEVIVVGLDQNRLKYPINRQSKDRIITLNTIERCKTERDILKLFDAYDAPVSPSLVGKALGMVTPENDDRLADCLRHPLVQVLNFGEFFHRKTINGHPIFSDLIEGENIEIVLPNKDAVRVVSKVIEEVQIPLKKQPRKVHESRLEIYNFELYYRPIFVFEFQQEDSESLKYEEFDALTGRWSSIPNKEIRQPDIPWDKVLRFSLEAITEIAITLGPPGAQIPAIILKTGMKYLND